MEQGALFVNAYCIHGILSCNDIQRIAESKINKLIIPDTIPHQQLPSSKEVLSCADLLVSAIDYLLRNKSVKEINQNYQK